MKIAVVGCGAVGSYYGAMLGRAGQEVHFLLRSDYDVVRRQGVSVRSPAGDFTARPHCAKSPGEIGVSDVVLIALKTTANDQLLRLLPPLVGPRTTVLTLQNGLGNEEHLATLVPAGQILGGLCFVCLNRVQPGVIQHVDHGLIVLGEFQRRTEPPMGTDLPGSVSPRTHDLAGMIRHAGVACVVTDNLTRAHWEKLVWNIPFNGLGVASAAGGNALFNPSSTLNSQKPLSPCLTTDQLLNDPRWEKLVRELMLEVISIAGALNLEAPESLAEEQLARTRTMGPYKASTLLDFERGSPLELESLFLEPLRAAQRAKVPAPRLAALCRVLTELDKRRGD